MARLGDPATGSMIAVATAGDVRALGLEVVPKPEDYDSVTQKSALPQPT